MTRLARLGVVALLTGGFAVGCDCDDPPADNGPAVRFLAPEQGATISCSEDSDTADRTVINYDVEAIVDLDGEDPALLVARLRVDGDDAADDTADIDVSGEVRFEDYALPIGPVTLVLEILQGESVVASDTRDVLVTWDPADPECQNQVPETTLTFVSPVGPLGTEDDKDGNLANGLQVDVTVEIDGDTDGDLELRVDQEVVGSRAASGGTVTFSDVTLDIGSGQNRVVLTAIVPTPGGGEAREDHAVQIEIDGCALEFEPPAGECIGGDEDLDPDTDGIQIELTARSNCGEVAFLVGARETVAVVTNGVASAEVTLRDGENEVYARASNPGGLGASTAPVTIVASTSVPVVDLTDLDRVGANELGLGSQVDGAWVLGGTASGLPAGSNVQITFDPALDGAPTDAAVAGDGTFSFAVEAEWYAGTVTVSGTDDCGARGASQGYEVVFDGVVPVLTLVAPEELPLTPLADEDEEADGVQVSLEVQVEDPRPANVDYEIRVQCTDAPPAYADRFSFATVSRSALVEGTGTLQAVFALADSGVLSCRAFAAPGPNAPDAPAVEIPLAFTQPRFTIINPRQPQGGIQCYGDEVLVGGTGQDLQGAVLTATVSDGEGEVGQAQLNVTGPNQYSVVFGADGGPDQLPDGRLSVSVAGVAANDVPVAVMPDAVEFIVDATAPVVTLEEPSADAPLGAEDDANGDLVDCVQTGLVFRLTDANANRVCYALGGGVERCGAVDEDGLFSVDEVTLLDGENVVRYRAVDCAGNETSGQVVLETAGCAPRIEIASPLDGAELAVAQDADGDAAGFQLDVTISTALAEGSEVEVVVDGGDAFGPATVAGGEAVVRVTVALPAEFPEEPLAFTLRPREINGLAVGPVWRGAIIFEPPELTITPLGVDCVNAGFADASIEDGFQVAFSATSVRLPEGAVATIGSDCNAATAEGMVDAEGGVAFEPLRIATDATCTITARALDGAGQEAVGVLEVVVDRTAPTVDFLLPEDGLLLNQQYDEDQRDVAEANGIQATVRVRVCGANGDATLQTAPALDGAGALPLDEDAECTTLELPRQTIPRGPLRVDVDAADACGNAVSGVARATVTTDASIQISAPTDGQVIRAQGDLDPEAPGCQVNLRAVALGLRLGVEYVVCTDFEQGEADPGCDGGYNALAAAGCEVQGEQGVSLACSLNLQDGVHSLTVRTVGEAEDILSAPVDIRVDCTRPRIVSVGSANDGNGDSCINLFERNNAGGANARSLVTLQVEVEGLEAGRNAQLRNAGHVRIADIPLQDGVGEVTVGITGVADGRWYVSATDAAGNVSLAWDQEGGLPLFSMHFDPVPPAPSLVNLAANQCLNAGMDADGDDGLQYTIAANAGGAQGETFDATLSIDAMEVGTLEDAAAALSFDTTLGDGNHLLVLTARDPCGNVGSVGGFQQVMGLDDWQNPLPVPFRVDTAAPGLVLGGVMDGATFEAGADADANAANGFQLDTTIALAPPEGIEAGQRIRVLSGQQGVSIAGEPLLVPANVAGPLDARLTLPPGDHTLTARASDTCGNLGVSEPVQVTVNIDGCASRLTSFIEDPAVIGPAAGAVNGGVLSLNITGAVDLFNPGCVGADAQIVLDNNPVGPVVPVPVDGNVAFADVPIPAGAHDVKLRVTADGNQTDSSVQGLVVDLHTPAVAFTAPAGVEPVAILVDEAPGTAGQQTTVTVRITEARVDSDRAAVLRRGGQQIAGPVAVGAGSPVSVSFVGVTVEPGLANLEVCVSDGAANEGCADIDVVSDPAAPGAIADLAATVVNNRSTEVDFTFTAPGDDGAGGGPVAFYEIRRSDAAIQSEGNWDAATLVEMIPYDPQVHVAPGAQETLTVEGLELNRLHHVSVRAVDDLGRMSALNSAQVDLLFLRHIWSFTPTAGGAAWAVNGFLNNHSLVHPLGDMDDDGFDDFLVVAAQAAGQSLARVVFGAADPADADTRDLAVPAGGLATYWGIGGAAPGDINGDGTPDAVVRGYQAGFAGSLVGLYFGTPGCNHPDDTAACRDAIASSGATIVTPGRFLEAIDGIGNFNQRGVDLDMGGQPKAINDIVLGGDGGVNGPVAFVVAGREGWAGQLSITEATFDVDRPEGVTLIEVPEGRVAMRAAGIGDSDGDGDDEIVFSAGVAINDVYRFNGGADLPGRYAYDPQSAATVKIPFPCAGVQNGWGGGIAGGVQLDGVGGPDFAVADTTAKRVAIFDHQLQNTDCFGRTQSSFGAIIEFADVDGDGANDVLVSYTNLDEPRTDAFVFYNDGLGRFGVGDVESPRGANVTFRQPALKKLGLATGDFIGDGQPDTMAAVKANPAGATLDVVLYYSPEEN